MTEYDLVEFTESSEQTCAYCGETTSEGCVQDPCELRESTEILPTLRPIDIRDITGEESEY